MLSSAAFVHREPAVSCLNAKYSYGRQRLDFNIFRSQMPLSCSQTMEYRPGASIARAASAPRSRGTGPDLVVFPEEWSGDFEFLYVPKCRIVRSGKLVAKAVGQHMSGQLPVAGGREL